MTVAVSPWIVAAPLALLTAASALAILHLFRGGERSGRAARLLTLAGTGALAAVLGTMALRERRLPVADVSQVLLSVALMACAALPALEPLLRLPSLGAFLVPTATALGWTAFLSAGQGRTWQSRELWMSLHGILGLAGFCAFAVAFATAAMYLLQERQLRRRRPGHVLEALPSLEALDRTCARATVLGFLFFTASLAAGAAAAAQAWSGAWMHEPVVVGSLASWVAYAFLVASRGTGRLQGRTITALGAAGFVLYLAGFLVPALLLGGAH
ncbi:MAG: cytochrome c biogenesis protein CcsA [Planctomycetes bacterium]|nr:cytochrome c biogenesis protein CcsA [Planctomycetota bacterium]